MKLLVHACCGPCSIMPTRLLIEAGYDVTVFYANSNIAPASEYEHRLVELQKYAEMQGFPVIEGVYDPAAWERKVAPIGEALKQYSPAFGTAFANERLTSTATETHLAPQTVEHEAASATETRNDIVAETHSVSQATVLKTDSEAEPLDKKQLLIPESPMSAPTTVSELLDDERRKERCRACYRMRLEEAAAFAASADFDALTTTLAVSPYQFTEVIREELERASAQVGIDSHFQDFRPYYDEATRISRELGIYRQNYCGCRFSIREGEATRAFIKQQRKERKARERAERAALEAEQAERRAEKQAYAKVQAKKRAILKSLRQEQSTQSN